MTINGDTFNPLYREWMDAVLEDARAVNSPNPTSFRAPRQSVSRDTWGSHFKEDCVQERRPVSLHG